ncbi:hypothetical protein AWB78_02959 [Caballeronia calidae]|uniref:Uncharacterized protein n=1 Tax=Caballeronia calidae TaxID=1777139 RepID=A0A158BQ74_9BURK|nr:hypothetical protein AWB78_02959 [Caballeronia calidae]
MERAIKKLRIGITIGLHHEAETLWNIGIKQNAVFLAEALKNCPNVQSVVLVNTTHIRITDQLPWDLDRWPTRIFHDVKDDLDVLIELGGQMDPMATDYLKQRGVHLVSYCVRLGKSRSLTAQGFAADRAARGTAFRHKRR